MDGIGLLIARVVIGLLMAAHGATKMFGWFGGYGLQKTGESFAQLGFRPGRAFAAAAALGEITGGLLVALMISVMIVAAITVHWGKGLLGNGIELPLLYAAAAFGLALTGPGPYSLDAWLGIAQLWTPAVTGIVLALGIVGGFANVAIRRPPAVTAQA
jgi:putative oxidoreductase